MAVTKQYRYVRDFMFRDKTLSRPEPRLHGIIGYMTGRNDALWDFYYINGRQRRVAQLAGLFSAFFSYSYLITYGKVRC